MLQLFFHNDDYCLADSDTFEVGLWEEDIAKAILSYFETHSDGPYPNHSCFANFHSGNNPTLIKSFPPCTSLPDFQNLYPEYFI